MVNETALKELIRLALAEDIGNGDHSTMACIPPTAKGKARLKIKEGGLLAGMQVAETIFRYMDMFTVFTPFKKDGDVMQPGDTAFEVEAAVHTLLMTERLVLNCMQRMSGIATLTRQYVDKLQGYHTRLLDTRKTTPNFRLLEKEAVRIGGGVNHRMGLYDMVMLKDNHIDFAGGITQAVQKTIAYLQQRKLDLKIEVETRNLDDVREALAVGGVDRIMLDNFRPEQIAAALELIKGSCETEASGGITLDNLVDYAKTGVDFISAGAVIHHAVSLDLSLKAVE
ncbi:carboxylating nicotinate-nucleotide diphosphorylase [Chitinophaga agrisoli]|uniref:Probable nicotinate-nucleotide pyrophosphorylase [carboxylating] n=1 Tax=Chitinophaga agrisoli TaxID=2607653 RepID=A0A5B2VXV9_9BACT|nr:carboxylating nicotinate-nucleotide diphosphorylase [Chitinophaga agrisoli]KAA2244693.1 carboxylating nicotinate-nucleotide diphosphorylase [Chitinophaga agrisoli]